MGWACAAGSNPQDALAAADAAAARADGLEDHAAVDGLEECVELFGRSRELQRIALLGDIDDAATEDLGHALHLVAFLADRPHLDEHELALGIGAVSYTH